MSRVEFEQALSSARSALEGDPRGELVLPMRRRIWDAMGPYSRDGEAPRGPGYQRRSRLDLLTAEKALARGLLDHADTARTRRALESAEYRLEMRGDPDLLRRQQNEVLRRGDNLLAQGQYSAGYAVHACAAAASTVLVDHDLSSLPDEFLDEELDPDTWDASYYAALAATANKNEPEEGRAFWSWYLNAAERAYDAGTLSNSGERNASPSIGTASPLASEDDIKRRVVAPLLSQLGFDASDLRYETQLHVTVSENFAITIGEARQQDKRAYPDIVCYRGESPLFVVEVKRDNEPLDEKARLQAITYARLLSDIAPFAVVANSNEARVYDVISGAEIQSVLESEYYKNAGMISLLPELRTQAERAMIGFLLAA